MEEASNINRLMINAHRRAAYARKTGRLVPKPCEICGKKFVDGHHMDYTKPLEIVWLCKKHHVQFHKKINVHILTRYEILKRNHSKWLAENYPDLVTQIV